MANIQPKITPLGSRAVLIEWLAVNGGGGDTCEGVQVGQYPQKSIQCTGSGTLVGAIQGSNNPAPGQNLVTLTGLDAAGIATALTGDAALNNKISQIRENVYQIKPAFTGGTGIAVRLLCVG